MAANAMVMEVDPRDAFAPLKNASGGDCNTPETVRSRMVEQHTRWLRHAGAEVDEGVEVEICPMFAADADELAGKLDPEIAVTEPTYFC
jgi:UDP-N-acetylglucosamine/UDP-N-acetylgalactosamine diphosphorylase